MRIIKFDLKHLPHWRDDVLHYRFRTANWQLFSNKAINVCASNLIDGPVSKCRNQVLIDDLPIKPLSLLLALDRYIELEPIVDLPGELTELLLASADHDHA